MEIRTHRDGYKVRPSAVGNGEFINTAPRIEQERRGYIRTFTGRYVNPLAMRARDIDIRDIAHHLSLITRYTGACPYHYSVGQHSLLVAAYLADEGASLPLQLAGLLHDAAEYVLNDIASPVKHDPRMKWYRDLDHETGRMILATFGVEPDLLAATKAADDAVFRREVATWWGDTRTREANFYLSPKWSVECEADPAMVENAFLTHFHDLYGQINP